MKQWMLNALLVFLALAVLGAVVWFVPDTRIIMIFLWKGVVLLAKTVWFVLIFVAAFTIPGLISGLIRGLVIDKADEAVEEYEKINDWVHVIVCVILSLVIGAGWIFGMRFLVGLPSWVHDIYVYFNWYGKFLEVLPWGWAIVGFVSSVIGYIYGSADNR
jgi:hypothetical protein